MIFGFSWTLGGKEIISVNRVSPNGERRSHTPFLGLPLLPPLLRILLLLPLYKTMRGRRFNPLSKVSLLLTHNFSPWVKLENPMSCFGVRFVSFMSRMMTLARFAICYFKSSLYIRGGAVLFIWKEENNETFDYQIGSENFNWIIFKKLQEFYRKCCLFLLMCKNKAMARPISIDNSVLTPPPPHSIPRQTWWRPTPRTEREYRVLYRTSSTAFACKARAEN